MRGITLYAAGLLALAATGCQLPTPSVPGQEPERHDTAQPPAPAGPALVAGTWTRHGDAPLVFDVTDDGQAVHGELKGAAEAGFTSYTFDLTHQGAGLEGKATFKVADFGDTAYEVAWKAKVDGTTITVEGEELDIDEEGAHEVRQRTPKQHVYDLVAATPAAAATPPPAPAMDMSQYVTPSPTYKYLLTDDIAVGQWVDVQQDAMGQKSITRTAVVGDAGDAWIIELDDQMNQKDTILAVFVDKTTGETKKAYVGQRGKAGKEKEVPAMPAAQGGDAPAPTDESVTVPAGTFDAKKTEAGGSTMWVGASGDAEGVLLRSQTTAGTDELKSLEVGPFEAGAATFEQAKTLTYTSGNVMVMAVRPTAFFHQMLRMKTGPVEMTLVGQGTDATPQFEYPR
jgi:hypothetical protein